MKIKLLFRLCGVLFLLTIALFIVGNMIMKNPLHDTQNYANTFQLVKENAAQYRVGNFLTLMGVTAQFALMITLYQFLKAANPFYPWPELLPSLSESLPVFSFWV